LGQCFDLTGDLIDAFIEAAPIGGQRLNGAEHPRRERAGVSSKDIRERTPQPPTSFRYSHAALQQERSDFIYNRGALTHKAGPHAVQRLQIELLSGLGCYKAHGWPLHGFSNRLGVAVIVLVSFKEGLHVFGRHEPGIMPKCNQPAAQMMGANASLHADQAGR